MIEYDRMRFAIATAATTYPVTSAEVGYQCRIGSTELTAESTYITNLIKAATNRVESLCGPIISQTWDAYLDEWPCGDTLVIKMPRVTSVTSVKYLIEDDTEYTTLSSATYATDFISTNPRIKLKSGESWPSDSLEVMNAIVIRIVAGYASGGTGQEAANVPMALKQAILFLCSHWYNRREPIENLNTSEVSETLSSLLTNYRYWG